MTRPFRQDGFSLLEVLVVVTLLALLATVTLPIFSRDAGPAEFDRQARRLADTLQRLNENSLFRGEMLAMRLTPEGYHPYRYSLETQRFEPMEDDALAAFELPGGLQLEWDLNEDGGAEAISLAEAAQQTLLAASKEQVAADEEAPAGEEPPQLFFFPSGEVTPVSLRILDVEEGGELKLSMDALGRVTVEGEDEEPEPEEE